MVVASLILITAGVLLYVLLPLRREETAQAAMADAGRDDLVARREALLFALQDLDFELETGKLSAEDHASLRARLEAEAVEVLAKLDSAGGKRRHAAPAAHAD